MTQCSVQSRGYRCPNPAREGGKQCEGCHRYRVEYMRAYREKRRVARQKRALLPRTCYSCHLLLPPSRFHVWEAKVGCHEICKACLGQRVKAGIAQARLRARQFGVLSSPHTTRNGLTPDPETASRAGHIPGNG